jgi:hypothetical protein
MSELDQALADFDASLEGLESVLKIIRGGRTVSDAPRPSKAGNIVRLPVRLRVIEGGQSNG